jgi:hypothetical protein
MIQGSADTEPNLTQLLAMLIELEGIELAREIWTAG